MKVVRITGPYFCAGIVMDGRGKVLGIAPILKYMKSWYLSAIRDYCKRKGWTVEVSNDSGTF